MICVRGREIERVAVVDDDALVRRTYSDVVYDMSLEVLDIVGPLNGIPMAMDAVSSADAVLCDHQLGAYAQFTGAEFVSNLYRSGKPAVLCTQWGAARRDELSIFRRWLPVVLEPPPEPDAIESTIEKCIGEFEGVFNQSRRAWRTLVRVENIRTERTDRTIELVVPGWNPNQIVARPLELVPEDVRPNLERGSRLFARVNIDALESDELYFFGWEVG